MGENEMINIIKFSYKFIEGQKTKIDEVPIATSKQINKEEAYDFLKNHYFRNSKPYQITVLSVRVMKE